MPKTSPLYNLINSFSPEQLKAYGIEKKKAGSRSYFIIHTSKDIQPVLADNYLLQDAHFSIDQYYNMDRHGYTPLHYTLQYNDKTIHSYLNIRAEYKYYEISPSTLLSPEQEAALKYNIQNAQSVLLELFVKQAERQSELQSAANQLDLELSNLSRTLDHKKVRTQYIDTAHKFIELIQELNLYSGTIDRRYISMARLIDRIEAIYECQAKKPKKSALEKSKETKDEPEEPQAKPAFSPEKSLENLFSEAMEHFSQSVNKFQKPGQDPTQLKDNIKTVNENLFVLYSFPEKMIKKDHRRKISIAIERLKQFYDTQSKAFEEYALTGNLPAFKAHFSHYAEYLTPDFYDLLINTLVKSECKIEQAQILNICHFLNEQDPHYRSFIFKLSQEKGYPVSTRILGCLANNPNFNEVDKIGLSTSLLLKLYFEEKIELFKFFLDQGADIHTWGFRSSRRPEFECFTVFYLIIHINNAHYLDYLKLLIEAGADPYHLYTHKILSIKNKGALKNASSAHVKHINFFDALPVNPLTLLSCKSGLEGLTLALPRAPLIYLALHLIELLKHPTLQCVFVQAEHYSVLYAENEDLAKAYALEEAEAATVDTIQNFSCYIPYPNKGNQDDDYKLVYEKMQLIHAALDKQVPKLTPEDFKKNYRELFNLAEEEIIRGDHVKSAHFIKHFINAQTHFLACELLLMKYVASHIKPPMEQRSFIQEYSHELYTKLIYTSKHSDNSHHVKLFSEIQKTFKETPFQKKSTYLTIDRRNEEDPMDTLTRFHMAENEMLRKPVEEKTKQILHQKKPSALKKR